MHVPTLSPSRLALLRRQPRPSTSALLLDRVLGVSRRRRQLAYLAIAGGFAMLRPLLRRVAVLGTVLVLWIAVAILF